MGLFNKSQTESNEILNKFLNESRHKIRGYGWKRDQPDFRDEPYLLTPDDLTNLPIDVDLVPQQPPVYDQGQLGSCTGNSIAGMVEFVTKKEGLPSFSPSRLFIYYNERAMEGTVSEDAGAAIRDGIKSIKKIGVCSEQEWPYNISKFADKPPLQCYTDAKLTRAISYKRVSQNVDHMRACLAAGYTFVFGFSVYDYFESQQMASQGILNVPTANENLLGGHAVECVGYHHNDKMVIVRNSWGPKWGIGGYFLMSYDYITNHNLASDFWTIRKTS